MAAGLAFLVTNLATVGDETLPALFAPISLATAAVLAAAGFAALEFARGQTPTADKPNERN